MNNTKLCFTLFLFLCICKTSLCQNSIVGAIRWDAWVGEINTDGVGAPSVGLQVERSLGPNKYHFRLPFYGVEIGADSVQARELTQTIMNQDIAYAKDAGIDYWAFVYYPDNSGLDSARTLYDENANKNDVKYCFILGASVQPSFTWLVSKFSELNYQKVLDNRPLLYIFGGAGGYNSTQITSIRNLATSAGLGTPYIVVMDQNSTNAANSLNSIGADAVSGYVTAGSGGGSYSGLVSSEINNWNSHKATGEKVVPWITSGWDNRPRYDNPVSWTTVGENDWIQTATAIEVADHLADGLNWIGNYPSTSDANTLLIYAWNEFDEGGWICPTLYNGTDRLHAIKNVISPPSTPNIALSKSYSSSSNWDTSQEAPKAFDANYSTNWQAAYGSTFSGQWIQVNFGAPTTFNRVKLSEFGNRTSGYRIEYSTDGTTWQSAFSGTNIGANKSINFTAVTGNFARIYFTSGQNTPIIYEFEVHLTLDDQALNKSYSSSSNWDTSQEAPKAFDANYSTNWQAANGSTFNGQWLQVNFGASATFDVVKLSEYGNRTLGYRIEYSSNGTTWNIAYTGTTIGSSKELQFTPVTANYARIYFTSGINTPIIFEFEIYNSISLKSGQVHVTPFENITNDEPSFNIYPNPVKGEAIFYYNLPKMGDVFIRIYNTEGKLMKTFNLPSDNKGANHYSVNLSDLKSGVYVVRCMNNGYSKSVKIVVQNAN